jgi:fatty acid desaturase
MKRIAVTKRPWIPVVAVLGNWAILFSCIAIATWAQSWPVSLLAIFIIGCRQHGLMMLMHDGAHMNLGWNFYSNEILADGFCSWPLLFDTQSYRKNHLAHHRSLNTPEDPDWVRKVGKPEWTFPVKSKSLLLFLPYFIFLRGPTEWLYICYKFSGVDDKARWKSQPLFLLTKIIYFIAAGTALISLGLTKTALLYWFVPLLFVFPLVQRFRSVAEHFALPYLSEVSTTREVTASWLEGFLFAPYNIHYHLTHHLHPYVPFYEMKQAHLKMKEEFPHLYSNTAYLFPYSDSVLRDLLHGPKQSRENIEKKSAS